MQLNELSEQWIDLACDRLGGAVLAANDESFAAKENLIRAEAAVFEAGRFTDRGKWMDGWETRRRRSPGHDWCVVRLAAPALVRGVVVDTAHFRGNQPEVVSLDVCRLDAQPSRWDDDSVAWAEALQRTTVGPDAEHVFAIEHDACVTHVRLNIHPDGGVARLRVYGAARPDWPALTLNGPADLAAALHGGRVVGCSDACFSRPQHLIMPGDGVDMGDGWETARRRGEGHDWCVLKLGARGVVERVQLDTCHFKGNYPDRFSLEIADGGADDVESMRWIELIPETPLIPDRMHEFDVDGAPAGTHARLNIFPDGGVSRLRLLGRPAE